jgi:formylmethanofuran dehydrogenase subunit D
MMFMLNTGRTIQQGDEIESKTSPQYAEATSLCFLHPLDAMDLGVGSGDRVRVHNEVGTVVLRVQEREDTERGSLYVPLGLHANTLIAAETHATGMPDFKSKQVEVTPTADPVKTPRDLILTLGGLPGDL